MIEADSETRRVRDLLREVLRTDADLEAFCLDCFPDVYDRFGTGMERTSKVNLLLTLHPPAQIATKLDYYRKQPIPKTSNQARLSSFDELKSKIRVWLTENHVVWKTLGPNSRVAKSDPGSNLYLQWKSRILDTIIPNNKKIISLIEANIALIPDEALEPFHRFKIHASSFEEHQDRPSSSYPRFPIEFERNFVK